MRYFRHNHLFKLAVLLVMIFSAFLTSEIYAAWSNPSADPTGSNTLPPLNEGDQDQSKSAGLSLLKLVVNGLVQIKDGTEGVGKVLVSDPNGVASWVATSTLGLGGPGSSNLAVTQVTTNDPNNESCSASCAAGEVIVGGGCNAVPEAPLQVNGPSDSDSWQCQTSPNMSFGGYSGGLTCTALCTEGSQSGSALPSCSEGQMLAHNTTSGAWECATPPAASGGIERLDQAAGILLSPNPVTDVGTISVDTSVVQRRINNCSTGEVISGVNADGSVQCEPAPVINCVYQGKGYSPGALCELSSVQNNCSSGRIYHNMACQEDGTWRRVVSSCGTPTNYPTCGQ